MNEQQGLAGQAAQDPLAGMSEQEIMQLVAEIIKLLQSGVTPEELLEKGVPQELIQVAMSQIQTQAQQQSAPQPNQPEGRMGGGLAASGGMV